MGGGGWWGGTEREKGAAGGERWREKSVKKDSPLPPWVWPGAWQVHYEAVKLR